MLLSRYRYLLGRFIIVWPQFFSHSREHLIRIFAGVYWLVILNYLYLIRMHQMISSLNPGPSYLM